MPHIISFLSLAFIYGTWGLVIVLRLTTYLLLEATAYMLCVDWSVPYVRQTALANLLPSIRIKTILPFQ